MRTQDLLNVHHLTAPGANELGWVQRWIGSRRLPLCSWRRAVDGVWQMGFDLVQNLAIAGGIVAVVPDFDKVLGQHVL